MATNRQCNGNVPAREDGKRIIVSLTSYPARMGTIHTAIESIYRQTMQPDEVVLWLYRGQFPDGYRFPDSLDYCLSKGLKVRWIDDDIKPHTKYFYALQEYSDDLVITVDDDAVYPPTRIEELYKSHLRFPKAVISARVHRMTFTTDGDILPYAQWERNSTRFINRPMYSLCALGVGGVLYPPCTLPPEAYNADAIKSTCLCADDIWLKFMEILAGVPVVRSDSENLSEPTIEGTQTEALLKTNCGQGANDIQLKNVVEYCERELGAEDPLGRIYRRYSNEMYDGELPADIPVRNPAQPVVSVIVPVYNVAKYLDCNISSIKVALERLGLPSEIILVEDGSTDGSDEILREYAQNDDRIGVIWQRNCGAGVARSRGLEVARGEFVCFCDPDDWIDPLMVDKLYHRAKSSGCDVVFCGRQLYDDRQKRFTGVLLLPKMPDVFSADEIAGSIFNSFGYVPWNKIIRRSMLMEHGIRFQDLPRNNDMYFSNAVLVAARRIGVVNEPLYVYRTNRVGSLQSAIDATPDTKIQAFRATYEFMKRCGKVEAYGDSFRRMVWVEAIVNLALFKTREVAEAFYSRLCGEWLAEFGLASGFEDILSAAYLPAARAVVSKVGYDEYVKADEARRLSRMPRNKDVLLANEKKKVADRDRWLAERAEGSRIRELSKEVERYAAEVDALKRSEAYRVGMAITWPLRKLFRLFKPGSNR